MLETLGEINWHELEHAYGPADDVPELLRALTSDTKAVRQNAWHKLWGNVTHQGTVYSVTSYVVPFLLELLETPTVQDKPDLLRYLAALAWGNSYIAAHEHLFEEIGVFRERLKQPEWQQRAQQELGWVQTAHLAVASGAPIYLMLLDDPDPEIRWCTAYTLAACQPFASEVNTGLLRRLSVEQDTRVKMSILLTLGQLAIPGGVPTIERYLSSDQTASLRTAAAIALIEIDQMHIASLVVPVLLTALDNPQQIDEVYRQLPWAQDDSVVSEVCSVLGRLSPDQAFLALPRMLDALDQLPTRDFGSVAIVGTILSLSFNPRKGTRRADELTSDQREILHRLAQSDRAWDFGNAIWIFRHFGLPDRKHEMAAFLEQH